MGKKRILSGMRPTDKLHLGNYEGALKNWVALQDEYEIFAMIADWHVLTTEHLGIPNLNDLIREVTIDYLAAGLDPKKCTIFVQSDVKEHAELHLLFSMITPTPWLIRNPTVKEQARDLGLIEKDEEITSINYGLLGYPVLQAADILIYKADAVPVGEDQVPHIELTRQIARRFNYLYRKEVFPEPEALLTKVARLPGLDGKKMSKSQGNVIYLSDSPNDIREKIKTMFTDPLKVYRTDPGDPEVRGCPAFAYHKIYNTSETEQIEADCKQAKLGCVDCKQLLAERLVEALRPIRDKRTEIKREPWLVDEALRKGTKKAKKIARDTMNEVRDVMGLRH